jgi:hypothetical protein
MRVVFAVRAAASIVLDRGVHLKTNSSRSAALAPTRAVWRKPLLAIVLFSQGAHGPSRLQKTSSCHQSPSPKPQAPNHMLVLARTARGTPALRRQDGPFFATSAWYDASLDMYALNLYAAGRKAYAHQITFGSCVSTFACNRHTPVIALADMLHCYNVKAMGKTLALGCYPCPRGYGAISLSSSCWHASSPPRTASDPSAPAPAASAGAASAASAAAAYSCTAAAAEVLLWASRSWVAAAVAAAVLA